MTVLPLFKLQFFYAKPYLAKYWIYDKCTKSEHRSTGPVKFFLVAFEFEFEFELLDDFFNYYLVNGPLRPVLSSQCTESTMNAEPAKNQVC